MRTRSRGATGAVIRPGGAARSLLIDRVKGAIEPRMPKEAPALTTAEIAVFQQWIDQGARETPASSRRRSHGNRRCRSGNP